MVLDIDVAFGLGDDLDLQAEGGGRKVGVKVEVEGRW